MGHTADDIIQNTYIRYSRMRGYSTRWILGTDHTGITTQTKVDKSLSQRVFRLEIGREKFLGLAGIGGAVRRNHCFSD